jgi:hypothetical protein
MQAQNSSATSVAHIELLGWSEMLQPTRLTILGPITLLVRFAEPAVPFQRTTMRGKSIETPRHTLPEHRAAELELAFSGG